MIILESIAINRAVQRIESIRHFKLVDEREYNEIYIRYFFEFLRRAAIWRQRIKQAGYMLFNGDPYSLLPFFDINRFWGEPFELPQEYLVIIDEITSMRYFSKESFSRRHYEKIFTYYLKFEIMKENKMLDNFEPHMYAPLIKMTEIGGWFSIMKEIDFAACGGYLDSSTIWKTWMNKYNSPPFIEFGE